MNKRTFAILLSLCLMMSAFSATAYATEVTVKEYAYGSTTSTENNGTFQYTNKGTIDVTAVAVTEAANNSAVYEVELVWGDLAFAWGRHDSYGGTTGTDYALTWNPATHTYTDSGSLTEDDEWYLINEETMALPSSNDTEASTVVANAKHDNVIIFNHSNAAVKATVSVADDNSNDYDTGLTDVSGYATATGTDPQNLSYTLPMAVLNTAYDASTTAVMSVLPTEKVNEGALSTTAATTIATITVTLTQVVDENSNTIALTQDDSYTAEWSVSAN